MAFNAKTFGHFNELVDYMNGVVFGKKLDARVYGLHGLTLIVNDGALKTVTFADATLAGLTPKQILAQIQAVQAGLVVFRDYGDSTPAKPNLAVVTPTFIVKGNGTANAILGFRAVDVTVTPLAQANIVSVMRNEGNRFHLIHV